MSKQIKRMELDALKKAFGEIRDYVVLSASKVDAGTDYLIRTTLRKKNIRLLMVKNTLARKVLGEAGITLAPNAWEGPTLLAWGTESIKDLSKAIDAIITEVAKKNPNIKEKKDLPVRVKTAVADGQEVPFDTALKMPTRVEAIGEVVGMLLGPASAIAGCLSGPASQVAGAIATIADKKEDAAPAA
jgi:large subunit ribosomal protein L10